MSESSSRPLMALTMGDPAGVGPELCLQAAADPEVTSIVRLLIVGDRTVLEQAGRRLDLPLPRDWLSADQALDPKTPNALPAVAGVDCGVIAGEVLPGRLSADCGRAAYRYLEVAIAGAMEGRFAAVVTAPLNKAALHLAGIHEDGHTGILRKKTGAPDAAMMLYSPRLVVAFATCHQSLRSVPESLTADRICRTAFLLREALLAIREREPRLAVTGLNPHAGEGGIFGREEIEVVAPAVERCRDRGWNVDGPLPPDAAFMTHNRERYDGYVALYHDQGHIPFKMISLHDGVNVTLGLPIVRTSVDHGTAFDIAWQGTAQATSLVCAIKLAAQLTRKGRQS